MGKPAVPCPKCRSNSTGVVSTFSVKNSHNVVRRRHCKDCKHRWYTLQYPEHPLQSYQVAFERPFKQNVYIAEVRQ